MSYRTIKKIPSGLEMIQLAPLSQLGHNRVAKDRQEIKDILSGVDSKRKIIIIGPCSAWPKAAVLDYARRLAIINEKVQHKLKLVMRVYIQKPRTVIGWSGLLNQPDLFNLPDIAAGMLYARSLMVEIVENIGLPIADEALFIHNTQGFLELLSWVAIGARSSENSEHRIFASLIDCAVGIKNPTSGSVKIGVNGVIAAQHSHVAAFEGNEIETSGNQFAHLVLRGGDRGANYTDNHLQQILHQMQQNKIKHPAVIIDVSHDNSIINGQRNHLFQAKTILEIMHNLSTNIELNNLVKGFMLESFIKDGRQDIMLAEDSTMIDMGGLSITDPCLGWEQTEELLFTLVDG